MKITCIGNVPVFILTILAVCPLILASKPPTVKASSKYVEFVLAIYKFVIALKLPDVPSVTEPTIEMLASCFPESKQAYADITVGEICGITNELSLQEASDCIAVAFELKNNVTGEFNMTKYRGLNESSLKKSTMSPSQQAAALAASESCVESNFTIPNEYYAIPPSTQGAKYNKRNDALRTFVCSAKLPLQNGCLNVGIKNKSK